MLSFFQVIFTKLFNTASRHLPDTLYTFLPLSRHPEYLPHHLKLPSRPLWVTFKFSCMRQIIRNPNISDSFWKPSRHQHLQQRIEDSCHGNICHASFVPVRILTNRDRILKNVYQNVDKLQHWSLTNSWDKVTTVKVAFSIQYFFRWQLSLYKNYIWAATDPILAKYPR